jgi:hypothetical protein
LLADEGRCLFAAAVDARTKARPGHKVSLAIDPSAFHFFDQSTGESLCRSPEMAAAHAA